MKICMTVFNDFAHDVRIYKEALSLIKNGHDVVLIAHKTNATKAFEIIDGIRVIRIDVPELKIKKFLQNFFSKTKEAHQTDAYTEQKQATDKIEPKKNNFILSIRNFIWFIRWQIEFLKAAISQKADVYHAHENETIMHGFIAAKINRSKLIYDSHEYYQGLSHANDSACAKLLKKFYCFMENLLIKHANEVITVNDAIAELMAKQFKIKKPHIIMNCPSINLLEKNNSFSSEYVDIINKYKSEGKYILLMQGIMNPNRGFETFLDSIKHIDNCIGLVVGGGSIEGQIRQQAKNDKEISQKTVFTGKVHFSELLQFTKLAHLGFVLTHNTCLNNYLSLPNKFFEYMLAGIPVVAPDLPEMKRIVDTYQVGIIVDGSNPNDIAVKVKTLLNDKQKYNQMRENALKVSREIFNWEKTGEALLSLYRNIG